MMSPGTFMCSITSINTPESSQCALVRAVVGGVVGEEGEVVAVEGELGGG